MVPPKVGQRAEMSVDSTVSQKVWTMVGLTAGRTVVQKVDLSADRWADQRVHPMVPPKVGQRAEMSADSTV